MLCSAGVVESQRGIRKRLDKMIRRSSWALSWTVLWTQ